MFNRPLPEQVFVDEDELFLIDDKTPFNIKIYKDLNTFWFCADDIAFILNLGKLKWFFLRTDLIKKEDYRKFKGGMICFSHKGILKFTSVRTCYNSVGLQQWIPEVLFKKRDLTKVHYARSVIQTNVINISCIYLLKLSNYKGIKPNELLVKFGKTNNLDRRLYEHCNTFAELDCQPVLVHYVPVPEDKLSTAEALIRKYFEKENQLVKINTFNELAVIPKKDLNGKVKVMFKTLFKLVI